MKYEQVTSSLNGGRPFFYSWPSMNTWQRGKYADSVFELADRG